MTPTMIARLVGVAIFVLLLNLVLSVLFLSFYESRIDPGHDEQYYEDYLDYVSPYLTVLVEVPMLFLAGWEVAGWWDRKFGARPAWILWLVCVVLGLVSFLLNEITMRNAGEFVVWALVTFRATNLGAMVRLRTSSS